MEQEERLSHEEVKRPKLQSSVFEFHQSMTECDLEEMRDWRRLWGVRAYRFFIMLLDGFKRTELTRRAAALTYTTILSIFPLLAVVTSMVSYFYTAEREGELTQVIERTLLPSTNQVLSRDPATLSEAERPVYEQQKKFSDDIRKMFSDVSAKFRQSAGGVGIFGFIGVLVTAGLLYYSIESVVNQTWQTGATRWTDTVRNLILVLLFAPIVIGLSMTASTMAATLFGQDEPPEKVVTKVEMAAAAETSAATDGTAVVVAVPEPTKPEPVITAAPPAPAPSGLLAKIRSVTTQFGFIIKVLPLLINTMILTLAYAFLPNTKVKFVAALTGGLVASLLWELARYGFFYYVYMSTVNKTLADALGLSVIFLIWVYITWMILLVGNLVVYVVHNFNALWMERRAGGEMMLDGRLLVATMLLVARRFKHHAPGYTESELRERLSLRKDEFTQVIGRLLRAGYVVRQESGAYILAQPPEDIRVRDLLEMGCNLAKLPVVNRIGPVSSSLMQLQQETLDGAGDRRLNELLVA